MDEEALQKIEAAYVQAFPDGVDGVEFIGIPEIDAAMKVAQCVPLLVRAVREQQKPPEGMPWWARVLIGLGLFQFVVQGLTWLQKLM